MEINDKMKIPKKTSKNYEFSTCRKSAVGSMYNVKPREGEGYFLRTALQHKSGVTSVSDMR